MKRSADGDGYACCLTRRLHPCGVTAAIFPRADPARPAVDMWGGGSMTLFSRAAADWGDGGYGPLVLAPIMHPGTVASLLPWTSGG